VRRIAYKTDGFILQLPKDCGSHFVRYRRIAGIQSVSPSVYTFNANAYIEYDFNFNNGDPNKPVRFKAHYGNHPNHLTAVGSTGTLTSVRGTVGRSWINDFSKWVENLSKLSFDRSTQFEIDQSVQRTLFKAVGFCAQDGRDLRGELSVKMSAGAFARGLFGIYVSGALLPKVRIDEAYVYVKAFSGATVTLNVDADIFVESFQQKKLVNIPLTPFKIPGVGTFGPVFEVDVGYQSDVSINAAFSGEISVNTPPLEFALGKLADGSNRRRAPSTTTQGTTSQGTSRFIQSSFQADFDASGFLRVFVVPRVVMDVDLLAGALDGRVGLEATVGPTATLSMSASAGSGSTSVQKPCFEVDIDADVAIIASAQALWGVTSASFTRDLYVLNMNVFKKCVDPVSSPRPVPRITTSLPETGPAPAAARHRVKRYIMDAPRLPSTTDVANTSDISIERRQTDQPLFSLSADLCPAEGPNACPALSNDPRRLTTVGQRTYTSCATRFYKSAPPVLASTNPYKANTNPNLFELCIGRGDFKYPLLYSGRSKINVFSAAGGARRVAGPSDREGGYFGQVTVVPKCDQPSQTDYAASTSQTLVEPNIQRGHILANRDATGLVSDEAQRTVAQRDTNTVANLVPQFSNFNNGDWKQLENFIQNLFGLPLQGRSTIDPNDAIEKYIRGKFKSLKVFKVAGSAQPESVQTVSNRLSDKLPAGSAVLATKYNRLVEKKVGIPRYMWMAVCVVFEDMGGRTFTESAAFIGINAPIRQSGDRAGCSCLLNPRPVREVASKVTFTSIFGGDGCNKDAVGTNLRNMMNTFGLIKTPAASSCDRLGLTCA
ncbi:hypothetical protein HK102_001733, partial [Quaeritorhiza haematococci]